MRNEPILGHNGKAEDLGFGHLGNGITVWDRTREQYRDYMTVAHISADRKITYRANPLSAEQVEKIQKYANTLDPEISATQDIKVFNTRPQ